MRTDAEERFHHLYQSTSRQVYAYLRRHCDADTAESVTCDVYVKAWRHADDLDDHPMGWLIQVARTTLYDSYRAKARRSRLNDDFFAATRGEAVPSPENVVVDRRALLDALSSLSDDDREALLLVGWDGLSHEDAAQVQGCSTVAFTKRLARARHRLEERSDSNAAYRRPIPLKGQP